MVQLGRKVKDRITGFTGTVTGFVTYISGCNQALVAPPVGSDGKAPDSWWLDEQRLDYVDESVVTLKKDVSAGFDRAPPVR